jgi:hypothetical protein
MFTYYRFSKVRLLVGVVMFWGVLFAPWWVPLICAVLLTLRFRAGEVILAGMFMDLYWMPSLVSLTSFDTVPFATIVAIILFFGLEPVRRQLLIGPEIL